MKYISYTAYIDQHMSIVIAIDHLLNERGRSFYWLAKEAGVSYSTLWRLKTGKALGINLATLSKICIALECTPGDLVILDHKGRKRKTSAMRSLPSLPTA